MELAVVEKVRDKIHLFIKFMPLTQLVKGFFIRFVCQHLFSMNKKPVYYTHSFFFLPLFLFLLSSCDQVKMEAQKTEKDSIQTWIQSSRNKEYSLSQKKAALEKAYQTILQNATDSFTARNLSLVTYRFYELRDTTRFFQLNEETIKLATKLKDSFTLGDAQWSYGDFYHFGEDYENSFHHYNKAYNYFNTLKNRDYEKGRMLFVMSFIKGRYRDYTGSEVLIFEAIKKFKLIESNIWLFNSYNHLASLQNDVKSFDKAIEYFKQAIEYLNQTSNNSTTLKATYNNIGRTYFLMGKYNEALNYYKKAVDKSDIDKYARVISNAAYCRLIMSDTSNVEKDLLLSLKIRDSLKNKTNILSSYIYLSDYYKVVKKPSKALEYSLNANSLAKKLKNGDNYLTTLKQLANLDTKNSKHYLDLYIQFNDSLIDAERKTLNKFTRIEFETDSVIADNKRLSQQQILISIIASALILILALVYFLRVQKAKTERLFLETEQQKANEEVYLMTIKQQAILEEEKTRERNRISQELHDGILGKLFGTRVGMGFLDLQGSDEDKQQQQLFLNELQEIEKEIRDVSHKLSDGFDSSNVNFKSIIHELFVSKSSLHGFEYEIDLNENISWKSVDELVKVNIYRMIQESIQNIIKHAKASKVSLSIQKESEILAVSIRDNGLGFVLKKARKGIGIKNMYSRVQKLGGELVIDSAPGEGTHILIKIPIKKNDN